jgi:hypothetical protein
MAKIRLRGQQAVKMRRKHGCTPKHDSEKSEPVSRLREAWQQFALSFDASAGEGRSEEIMLWSGTMIRRNPIAL